ncbi:LysM peptidoglycan-binding domain-containing protein [Streptomyces sp. ST2-7A]|uniref:LysM peptidoglycan-binding domain-containing protein n=1 Tax=Streptomyces sp. ST2-7A TaxID=2907214 RepID=UPI001F43E554|nr:LysM peptidoglycan-binding domain-containing protein [Streptomyces sp. ST2-7A]MCE7081146.1 LysM peptidoglycan-binding domain-containing protein [Streptomyces sp. ST2-7A]
MDLISREQWGARAFRVPNGATVYGRARAGVKLHYLGSAYSDRAHSQCAAYVRALQASHMDGNGWSDIGYSFLVCTHGAVFEGRGLHRRNSANGNASLNDAHYAVCALLGASGLTEPPDAQLHGLRDAIEYCRREGPCGNEIARHADGFATACPGPALTAWVRAGAPRPAGGSRGPGGTVYVVRAGDTLSGIAAGYPGVSWEEIHAANRSVIGADPGRLTPGQRLTIPAPAGSGSGSGSGSGGGSSSGARTHTVRSGETLSGIAAGYAGVSWQQLAQANRIAAPYTIRTGQVLAIPAAAQPAPYVPPPFPKGLRPGSASPSAVPWQRCLKRLGFMPGSVAEHPNYGPATQDATARFHNAHPQYRSAGVSRDVAVGSQGWAHAHRLAYGGNR